MHVRFDALIIRKRYFSGDVFNVPFEVSPLYIYDGESVNHMKFSTDSSPDSLSPYCKFWDGEGRVMVGRDFQKSL